MSTTRIHVCDFTTVANAQEEHNGKTYYFDFSEMYGPLFLNKKGEVLDKQPGPRSNAFKAFNQWYDGYKCAKANPA